MIVTKSLGGKMERPKEFDNERKDCTVVALTIASYLPYAEVHEAFRKCGRKEKHGFHIRGNIHRICKLLNLEAKQVKRSGSLGKFVKDHPIGDYICHKRGHAFAVSEGAVYEERNMGCHIKGAWLIQKR